ncbi:MAG: hypothetical protein M1816_003771 [Peltula sp. TS41687]|nr:MAG: hypothetical protein M1816_003771 [Peltula sp. TS41687]
MAGRNEAEQRASRQPITRRLIVRDPPKFDLETYIGNYTGRTRFDRLYLIGCSSAYLSIEALKAAIVEAKKGRDVGRYVRAVETLHGAAPGDPDATLDAKWIETTSKKVAADTERMEAELKGYKHNLIKESIRMGNEGLGQHYHEIGDLQQSFKAYSRMRDYCTSSRHISDMSLRLILVSIEQRNWMAVQSNVLKARGGQFKQEDDAELLSKLTASMGLAQMASGNYRSAAESFIRIEPSLGNTFKQVLTANDVAVYGGLCALASVDRHELQTKVLDNSKFRTFLELEPHIRRAITFFCASKYSQCLEILEAYKADYLLDLHLQKHVQPIYSQVRSKSIIQFLSPFGSVSFDRMAKAFRTDERSLEDELVGMIKQGYLQARIDAQNKLLVAKQTDPRQSVYEDTLEMVKRYERAARLKLMRMNIILAGLEVKSLKAAAATGLNSNTNNHLPPGSAISSTTAAGGSLPPPDTARMGSITGSMGSSIFNTERSESGGGGGGGSEIVPSHAGSNAGAANDTSASAGAGAGVGDGAAGGEGQSVNVVEEGGGGASL